MSNSDNLLQPIIITCRFTDEVADYFNRFRQQYFPPEKNYLKAHLTLFHHIQLPVEEVLKDLESVLAGTQPFKVSVERIAFTGRGVAFVIKSDELIHLHKRIVHQFKSILTPQDKQGLWPHVTIQNKAMVDESKSLADALQKSFQSFTAAVTGLQLYYYNNGPWEFIRDIKFMP